MRSRERSRVSSWRSDVRACVTVCCISVSLSASVCVWEGTKGCMLVFVRSRAYATSFRSVNSMIPEPSWPMYLMHEWSASVCACVVCRGWKCMFCIYCVQKQRAGLLLFFSPPPQEGAKWWVRWLGGEALAGIPGSNLLVSGANEWVRVRGG